MSTSGTGESESHKVRKDRLRKTLHCSQREAVASATMTGASDNFLNAFAIFLQATALQMGWLTAIPQLFGAMFQIVSVWLGNHVKRKPLVVAIAAVQSLLVGLLAVLAVAYGLYGLERSRVIWLIVLTVGYFSCLNIIQPHWRAWMGSLVPPRRRGVFFAARTRLTMIASLLVFVGGGLVLSVTDADDRAWLGFAILFSVAAIGRLISSFLLGGMHDPEPDSARNSMQLLSSWRHVQESLRDPTFRQYSFFVACMQGTVAISAPFFAVYMLRDLEFTYLQFSINSIASIATQFVMLRYWGRFSDRFGNHLLMVISSCLIPLIPILWMLSSHYYYLILVQMISGLCWSGFTLSTANYLYDIRPHQTNFALYAAIQSGTSALLVFCGGLMGGYVALHAPDIAVSMIQLLPLRSDLFVVFIASTLLRVVVVVFFVPRLQEPKIRRRPKILEIIFRVTRYNAISGISLDWMSVTRKTKLRNEKRKSKKSKDINARIK